MKTLKTFILILLILNTLTFFAQNKGVNNKYEVLDPNHAGKIFRNPIQKAEKPSGSPYKLNTFTQAKVANVDQKAFMRYNIFKDEFEFLNAKKDTLILDKLEDFNTISFNDIGNKYELLNYSNSKNNSIYGYLIPIYEKDGFTLYKKENINFYEGKVAKTTLERSMPSKFVQSENTYFFKNKQQFTTELPSSKKNLNKLFPDKKEAIDTYFKENKLGFKDENDLKKILDLISGF
jgi:hypothetical protein